VGLNLATKRYVGMKDESEDRLRQRMKELAERHKRFGLPRLHLLLRREGLVVNKKRTERVYREERLMLRRKRPKRKGSMIRVPLEPAFRKNHRWSMDFVHDSLVTGRRIKCLTIVDDFTKELPRIEVGHSISGFHLVRILEELRGVTGLPEEIRSDNGPEFQSKVFLEYCLSQGINLRFTRPGKPTDNSFIESLNGKFRDECLNESCFLNLEDAKEKIETWREFYNRERPHSSLQGLAPEEFARQEEYRLTA